MAEERICPIIVTSESTEMDSNSADNPPPPPPPSSGARRHSMSVKPDATKRRVPIHLRASTGSCHDTCKFGKHHSFEEKTREPFRKRTLKPSPKEADFIEVFVPGNKQKEEFLNKKVVMDPLKITASKSSPNEVKPVKMTAPADKNQKKHSSSQTFVSRDKTRLPNLTLGKKSCDISELPKIIKREILQPSETAEVSVEEGGSSNDNKMSRADKKTSDQSVKPSSLIKVKPLVASGVLGKKMTSLESPSAARSSPRFYLGKTAPSKATEAGRVKLPLTSMSPAKYREGIAELDGEAAEKDTLNPKARKGGRVNLTSPLSRLKGIEVKPDSEDSDKTLHINKTEAENKIASPSSESPSGAKTTSVSSLEENEEIRNSVSIETGNVQTIEDNHTVSIETGDIQTMEENHTVSIETGDIQTMEENHTVYIETGDIQTMEENHAVSIETGDIQTMEENTRVTSPSSSSQEAEDGSVSEKTDKNLPQEIENSQLSDEIHDGFQPSSSQEEDCEEDVYPSSLSDARSSYLPPLEENDEQVKADDPVSDKANSTEVKKVLPRKENSMSIKNRLVHSEDKNRIPVKLKFRRGKIIDHQPENNVPKRLKFRRLRNKSVDFASDSVKPATPNRTLRKTKSSVSDSKRPVDVKLGTPNRSLRKSHSVVVFKNNKYRSRKEKAVELQTSSKSPTRLGFSRSGRVVSRAEDGGSDLRKKNIMKARGESEAAGGSELISGKVVLKHPEVERKSNDDRVLLNNVIEETASKLVESRISKVKALVGAFETVISLQETKPSFNSHTPVVE